MTLHTRRSLISLGAAALVCAAAAPPLTAEPQIRLASAQVVQLGEGAVLLRLAASGPVAFTVLPPDVDGGQDGQTSVRARLHGVRPGTLATLGTLAPFGVTTTPDGGDTILTVTWGGEVPGGLTLQLEHGRRSNEIEAVFR